MLSLGGINKKDGSYVCPKYALKTEKYKCIDCEKDLILRQGDIRKYHFAHKKDNDCEYYNKPSESQIHKDAKLLLKSLIVKGLQIHINYNCNNCNNDFTTTIPKYNNNKSIELEHRFEYNGIKIADIAYIKNDKILCIFEICYKNATKEENRPEPWFEIDAETLIESVNDNQEEDIYIDCIRKKRQCNNCNLEKEKYNNLLIKITDDKKVNSKCDYCKKDLINNLLLEIIKKDMNKSLDYHYDNYFGKNNEEYLHKDCLLELKIREDQRYKSKCEYCMKDLINNEFIEIVKNDKKKSLDYHYDNYYIKNNEKYYHIKCDDLYVEIMNNKKLDKECAKCNEKLYIYLLNELKYGYINIYTINKRIFEENNKIYHIKCYLSIVESHYKKYLKNCLYCKKKLLTVKNIEYIEYINENTSYYKKIPEYNNNNKELDKKIINDVHIYCYYYKKRLIEDSRLKNNCFICKNKLQDIIMKLIESEEITYNDDEWFNKYFYIIEDIYYHKECYNIYKLLLLCDKCRLPISNIVDDNLMIKNEYINDYKIMNNRMYHKKCLIDVLSSCNYILCHASIIGILDEDFNIKEEYKKNYVIKNEKMYHIKCIVKEEEMSNRSFTSNSIVEKKKKKSKYNKFGF